MSETITKVVFVVLVLVIVGYAAHWYHTNTLATGYAKGYAVAQAEGQAMLDELDASAKARYAAAVNAAAREKAALEEKIYAIDQRRFKERKLANDENEQLQRDIAAGTKRLSVPAGTNESRSQFSAGASRFNSPAAAGSGPADRTELDPATAAALVDITQQGDRAIAERNELAQRYETVRCAVPQADGTPATGCSLPDSTPDSAPAAPGASE